MAIPSEVLRAMVAKGATADMIVAAVEADQAIDAARRAEVRAKAAAKKRRQRAEVALQPFCVPDCPGDIEGQEGTSGDEPGQPGTDRDIPGPAGKENPHTPIETIPSGDSPSDPKGSSAPKGADGRRGTRIPDDFEHLPEARKTAADLGFVGTEADEALAEFCDYWRSLPGPKARKLDWVATLRNRLREVARRRKPASQRTAPAPRLSGPTAAALARRQEMTDAPAYAPEPAVVRPFPGRRRGGPDAGSDPVARDGARGVGMAGGGARDAHLDGPGTLLDFAAQRAHG